MEELPSDVEEILDEGTFCYVGTSTRHGPHVTPMVFTVSNDRVWVTTSRGSVKAHSWRDDAQIGGLVRSDDASVTFTGRVRTFDLLETDSWGRDVREAPALTRAAARFTKKNAHFFAGYAVDARHVPLSWTPPGRVFASVELERAAVVGREHVVEPFGAWPDAVASLEGFRAARRGDGPLLGLPYDVREALGVEGFGALALEGRGGPVVLPVSWVVDGAALYAALPERELAIAGLVDPVVPAALAIDRASWWRAKLMTGAMLRGRAEVFATDRLASGGKSADRIVGAAGLDPDGSVLVRVRPNRLVWWQGWSSGTVVVG
jgi:nitroimidazol reductase NimA-like FMN-containing flavoprotein (pyridoxamine 5'-phosphate oxidase superfamily)